MNSIRTKKTRQTFTLPEDIFHRFATVIPEGQRSAIVASLLEKETKRREDGLARACQAANKRADLLKVEDDFQALEDTILEPFDPHA